MSSGLDGSPSATLLRERGRAETCGSEELRDVLVVTDDPHLLGPGQRGSAEELGEDRLEVLEDRRDDRHLLNRYTEHGACGHPGTNERCGAGAGAERLVELVEHLQAAPILRQSQG